MRADTAVAIYTLMLADLRDQGVGYVSIDEIKNEAARLRARSVRSGMSFFTVDLPRLGKAFDKALLKGVLECPEGFAQKDGLPVVFGNLFKLVFSLTGQLLDHACPHHVGHIRQLLYLFYKYELPHSPATEQAAVDSFIATDGELPRSYLGLFTSLVDESMDEPAKQAVHDELEMQLGRMRSFLHWVLEDINLYDISPRMGSGAVAGKQKCDQKFVFDEIPASLLDVYGVEYFRPDCDWRKAMSAAFDRLVYDVESATFKKVAAEERLQSGYVSSQDERERLHKDAACKGIVLRAHPTRMCLVPKDSRGPRVISCEPNYAIWIQLGIMEALYDRIQSHPLTKGFVNFTDQTVNGRLALEGSLSRVYSTLDLKDASDRVSLALVECVFPERILTWLKASRSSATMLPNGKIFEYSKFAPMGSALCFPVLALVVWAALKASDVDAYVYGDDVVVPTDKVGIAIVALERVGLRLNKDKCCTTGFFRESCGVDAYKGIDVTPLKFKAVWTYHRTPASCVSWIEYTNALWERKFTRTAIVLRSFLDRLYSDIPERDPAKGISEGFVWTKSVATNEHLNWNWDTHLQRRVYRFLSFEVRKVTVGQSSYGSYVRALSKAHRTSHVSTAWEYRLKESIQKFALDDNTSSMSAVQYTDPSGTLRFRRRRV